MVEADRNMAKTSLVVRDVVVRDVVVRDVVVRDGNGNCNSSPAFLFSVWGHPRVPHVSKNMDTSCRRKSNNSKRTRKRT